MVKSILKKFLRLLLSDKEGYITGRVWFGNARGIKLRLKAKDELSAFFSQYEKLVTQKMTEIVKPGWTVWDCGIYYGYFSLLLGKLVGPKGRVLSVDADKLNAERAGKNFALNGADNIKLMLCAIGRPNSSVAFYASGSATSHAKDTFVGADRKVDSDVGQSYQIGSHSLDELISLSELPAPNLVKIDIEGSEVTALKYAEQLFKEIRPYLIIESHNPESDQLIWDIAKNYLYEITSLDSGKKITKPSEVSHLIFASPMKKSA